MSEIDINMLNKHLQVLHARVIGLEAKFEGLSKAMFKILQYPYNKQYKEIMKLSDQYFKDAILKYYQEADQYEKDLLSDYVQHYQNDEYV